MILLQYSWFYIVVIFYILAITWSTEPYKQVLFIFWNLFRFVEILLIYLSKIEIIDILIVLIDFQVNQNVFL